MSDTKPVFLTLAEVLEIHADQLRLFGGSEGIRDQGALEWAIASPEATFAGAFLHETVWERRQPTLSTSRRISPFSTETSASA